MKILTINPGNSSTKIGLFEDDKEIAQKSLTHSDKELAKYNNLNEQQEMRAAAVALFLEEQGINKGDLKAVVGRGGLLKPIASGTWKVTEEMLHDLKKAERGEHASNLGGQIAYAIAREHGAPAFIVDPVSVDEMEDEARWTGVRGVYRQSLSHALNMKAVCKRYAKEHGKNYNELNLIVAHMGSGTSLSAHKKGRMIDVINPKDEGPISGDRAGTVPSSALMKICFKENADPAVIKKMLFGDGGMYALLGVRDIRDAIKMAEENNEEAKKVISAICYQVSKYIGEMGTVLQGEVDAIILTGGMAYNGPIVEPIKQRAGWIAPVTVYPGEDELKALCEGALRVLKGEEQAFDYR